MPWLSHIVVHRVELFVKAVDAFFSCGRVQEVRLPKSKNFWIRYYWFCFHPIPSLIVFSLLMVDAQMGTSEGELPFTKENLDVSLTAPCFMVFLRPGIKSNIPNFLFLLIIIFIF